MLSNAVIFTASFTKDDSWIPEYFDEESSNYQNSFHRAALSCTVPPALLVLLSRAKQKIRNPPVLLPGYVQSDLERLWGKRTCASPCHRSVKRDILRAGPSHLHFFRSSPGSANKSLGCEPLLISLMVY